MLLGLAMVVSPMRFGRVLVQAAPQESNTHLSLAQQIAKAANKSSCWLCTHLPERSGQGLPLLGIPVPANVSWDKPGVNAAALDGAGELEPWEWEVCVSVPSDKYCLCVERQSLLASPSGTDHSGETVFVGNFSGCAQIIPAGEGRKHPSWPAPGGRGWYWICGTRARKVLLLQTGQGFACWGLSSPT